MTSFVSKKYFTDHSGTYHIDKLFDWVNAHPEQHREIPTERLQSYLVRSTLSEDSTQQTNLQTIFTDPQHRKRMMAVDLSYPIMITNFGRVIDGVHRIFRAVFESHPTIKAIFIPPDQLRSVRIDGESPSKESLIANTSFPDQFLILAGSSLPQEPIEQREKIEAYFVEHLPTVSQLDDHYEVRLERPSSPYGSYTLDLDIYDGLNWWQEGMRIRQIPGQYRLYKNGILALEEQWVPLSWSRAITALGEVPQELIVLHLDDHDDMMAPLVGKRLDDAWVDYITGEECSLLDINSLRGAIASGAIGKGSILTPLIHTVDKVHVRHLTARPSPQTTYRIDPTTTTDSILFSEGNRLDLDFTEITWDHLHAKSSYVVTNDISVWLRDLPPGIPVFLHFDMDYFNDRFDGCSDWGSMERSHNPSLEEQLSRLEELMTTLQDGEIMDRVIDTSIGISPSFFPAEYWKPMVESLLTHLNLQEEE